MCSKVIWDPTFDMWLKDKKEFLYKKETWDLFEQLTRRRFSDHKRLFRKIGGLRREDIKYDTIFVAPVMRFEHFLTLFGV